MLQFHSQFIKAMKALNQGGVIAYPTEGVWGLGCDPFDEQAVLDILDIKSRPVSKGLILVSGDIKSFDFLIYDLSSIQYQMLEASWPGHNTWLVPHKNRIPSSVHGKHDTVAIRVSNHPLIKEICDQFGGPIVSTSANPAGCPSAKTSIQVRRYFSRKIANEEIALMPGRIGNAQSESTIRCLSSGKILRN